jgi:YHS domain-containing protein
MNRSLLTALLFGSAAAMAFAQDKPAAPKDAKPDAKPAAEAPAKAAAEECTLLCPVSGEPISLGHFTREKGERVYFCCGSCVGKYKASPEKFADKAKAQLAANKPLRAQIACPVTGGAIDKKVFAEEPMYDLYFSSEDAKKQYAADKGKYAAKLASCFTYQTHCVVMGGKIDPAVSKEIDGKKVYFCCDGCQAKFEKDKEASFKKLSDQMKANEAAYAKLKDEHKAAGKKGG